MARLVIEDLGHEVAADGAEHVAHLRGAENYLVRYRTRSAASGAVGDPFLTAALVPAMAMGIDALEVRAPVSEGLLRHLTDAQEILGAWDSRLRLVAVDAPLAPPSPRAPGVGAFFSGGVDSFYTVLRHLDEITHLVFVRGFDINLRDEALYTRVASSLRSAAAELGLPLIEVATNVRGFADRYVDWSERYHGSALASVAHLLAPTIGRIYLPASFGYDRLDPYGSHPLLDPLWGSDRLELIHDGAGATRGQKVAAIAGDEVAMRWLRVCWENRGGEYNCGQCEKCLRTMTELAAVGALQSCRTFDRPLDLEAVSRVVLDDAAARQFVAENLSSLRQRGGDKRLERALAISLGKHPLRDTQRRVRRHAGRVRRRLVGPPDTARIWSPTRFMFDDRDRLVG